MKKLVTMMLLAVLAVWSSYGQTPAKTNYLFGQMSGTYTPITGTQLWSTFDNEVSPAITLPFAFTYLGTPCDRIYVTANGWVKLTTASGTPAVNSLIPIEYAHPYVASLVSPLGGDLVGRSANASDLSYTTLGTAPNRIFVVQWKNASFKVTGTPDYDGLFNFQIRLHETSQVVSIVYGAFTAPATARAFQVGIKGATPTDFNNRLAATSPASWGTTLPGTAANNTVVTSQLSIPSNGLTFVYRLDAPVMPALSFNPANNAINVPCVPTFVNTPVLSWLPNLLGGGVPTSYDVYISTSATMPVTPTATVATASLDASALIAWAPNTIYYWQVVPKNALSTANIANCPINAFTTYAGTATLTGRALNFINVPVVGAAITAAPASGAVSFNATTDVDGIYTFSGIPSDTYTLTATHLVYNKATVAGVSVPVASNTVRNITLLQPTMGILPNPLNITLRPGEASSSKVTITNAGPGILTWTSYFALVGAATPAWMTMPTISGTVNGNTNVDVPVNISTTGLPVGTTKQANITFKSTNPIIPDVVIPVNLLIDGAEMTGVTNLTVALTEPVLGHATLTWENTPTTGFLYYIVKRNGVQIYMGANKTFIDDLATYGIYNYEVYAVYADGISASAFKTLEWASPVLTYSPATVTATVWTGTSEAISHTVGNTGTGNLHYEFTDPIASTIPMPTGYCTPVINAVSGHILGIAFSNIVSSLTPSASTSTEVWQNTNPVSYTASAVAAGYTDNTAQVALLQPGGTYLFELKIQQSYSAPELAAVWIDFNRNGVFDAAEKMGVPHTVANHSQMMFRVNIVVPASAPTGFTRMRVIYSPSSPPTVCPTAGFGECEDFAVNILSPLFATDIAAEKGIVAPGTTENLTVKFSATGDYVAPGVYTNTYRLVSNDLNTPSVTRTFQMTVIEPSALTGTIINCMNGTPLAGVTVSTGSFSTLTDEGGSYSLKLDPGTYTVTFNKLGFQPVVVNGVTVATTLVLNDTLCAVAYQPACANAARDIADTKVNVSWCTPAGLSELSYDDGVAEDYASWTYAGNMYAVRFTPATYPAKITGASFHVGTGAFPVGGTIMGATFKAAVYSVVDGKPGALLGTEITTAITASNLVGGWVSVTGLNVQVASGDVFVVMTPLEDAPNCAPIGIDKTPLTYHRSFTRNVLAAGEWQLSPNQDLMIRAIFEGAVVPPMASKYRISRIALANSTSPVIPLGVSTLLAANHSGLSYTDSANVWTPLPAGWYAYSIEAIYPNGEISPKVYTNLVPHKMDADVVINVSLTTGGSPAGALVSIQKLDFPNTSLSMTVPASGTVSFFDLTYGTYTLTVTKSGFETFVYTFALAGNRTIPVILGELRPKPTNLYVDNKTLKATWDAPVVDLLPENFEGAIFPPAGWATTSEGVSVWRSGTNASSQSFTVPPHTKYAYGNENSSGPFNYGCCDYLITPTLDLTSAEALTFKFQYFFTGAWGNFAFVEISIDGGINYEVLQAMPPQTYVGAKWREMVIDLTPYSGADGYSNVKLRFHTDDAGKWADGMAIDDVSLIAAGVNATGYGLFIAETGHSESEVGQTPIDVRTFQYSRRDVEYGKSYTASVAAIYTSGYSDHDYYTFTSSFLFPARDLVASTNGTCNALLEWSMPDADLYTKAPEANTLLFDNGPLANSLGTGAGGADESLLHSGLDTMGVSINGMESWRIADDFTVPASATGGWDIKKLTFYAFNPGDNPITSNIARLSFRIFKAPANPNDPYDALGVFWGESGPLPSVDRLTSTEFSNIYRGSVSGSTARPIIKLNAANLNIHLAPGKYWIEWIGASKLSTGLFVPAVTINGQTTTGDARRRRGNLPEIKFLDNGFQQGVPFRIEGEVTPMLPVNLLAYNIYRDSVKIVTVPKTTTSYWDQNVTPGEHCYTVKAVYDLAPYGVAGSDESEIVGPGCLDVTCGMDLPFVEEWTLGTFEENQWTATGENWIVDGSAGNPAPAAKFKFDPLSASYSQTLESPWLNATKIESTLKYKIWLDFDYMLDDRATTGFEALTVEVSNGGPWVRVKSYTNIGDKPWTAEHLNISLSAKDKVFKVRFRANGQNTGDIVYWMIDNVRIYPDYQLTGVVNLTANAEGTPQKDIRVKWEDAPNCEPFEHIMDDGVPESGFSIGNNGVAWMGGEFTNSDKGVIQSVDMFFKLGPAQPALGLQTIDIFDTNRVLIGSSNPFASVEGWQTITFPEEVEYKSTFYIMLKWNFVSGTNALAFDINGPQATANKNWYKNVDGWYLTHNVTGPPCAFLIRPKVCNDATGKKIIGGETKAFKQYQLYRAFAPSVSGPFGTYQKVATTTQLEYLDQDLPKNCYSYYVTAVWDEGESAPSNKDADCSVGPEAVTVVEKDGILLYPNPATTTVYVSTTKNVRSISVYNTVGALVYTQVVTAQGTIEIPTNNFAAGAYSVRIVTTSGETLSSKFIVTK